MRYFYDTEFIEDGTTIDLISIGIVAEDGRELYLVNAECDIKKAWKNEWIRNNVLRTVFKDSDFYLANTMLTNAETGDLIPVQFNYLTTKNTFETIGHFKSDIVTRITNFMNPKEYGKPELWGYYADYDHVVFCQLFGTMMDLPDGFPMFTMDLKQWQVQLGNPELPKQESGEHNALEDAKWNKQVYDFLEKYKQQKAGEWLKTYTG